jgi:hypothetical protein
MKIFRISAIIIDGNIYEFYHGTSSKALYNGIHDERDELHSITNEGLEYPYLAASYELAEYYAELMAENFGGEPVVLKINNLDSSKLQYDSASMNEPVMADEEERNEAWDIAAIEHPEWYDEWSDTITIPPEAWKYSYHAVGAVKYNGTIPLSDMEKIS